MHLLVEDGRDIFERIREIKLISMLLLWRDFLDGALSKTQGPRIVFVCDKIINMRLCSKNLSVHVMVSSLCVFMA